ncbi:MULTISPECIES: alpha/beta hydrolase [Rhodopseudomonas]|uniref:Alpha/beta hydrolase n=1 Tax=Rhodopseudomonas palustris TaxID=1076 RepID=A0A0D7EV72_RHOPL|nr:MULTISPECIES: alpha/beta hydrolase [Rhodopseudomonas]KIZ44719.1 alpha/beta hydrolase [Rhodopseudomonas palustris]MDF3813487.1 alpha/beta hydrolase [Rhodopseudomonas sp. BAL398]WOK18685.1 alpha/beta hydrolase [Rhodopseudomonas sp. BAL398]
MPISMFRGGADARVAAAPTPLVAPTHRGEIEYISAGAGPAVLALHGGMGGVDQSLLLFRAAIGDAAGLRVIAVSRPGYLGTPLAGAETPERQADLAAALLDRLEIPAAFVIAVSAGGPSALQFALRHRSRCRGLILVSCCTGRLDIPAEVRSRLPMMRWLARLPWLVAMMRWRADADPGRTAARSIRDPALLARTLAHPEAGVLLRTLQSSAMSRLAARLPGTENDITLCASMPPIAVADIDAPILAIHGTADRVVPFAHGRRIADQARQAELMAIDGGEHVSLFTHLDDIRERVRGFLRLHGSDAR